jgi:hypothetical protein
VRAFKNQSEGKNYLVDIFAKGRRERKQTVLTLITIKQIVSFRQQLLSDLYSSILHIFISYNCRTKALRKLDAQELKIPIYSIK